MVGNLYYDCNGESWTILNFHSEISFSTERGLKQAINRKIRKDLENGNLRRFFGTGARVNVNVYFYRQAACYIKCECLLA